MIRANLQDRDKATSDDTVGFILDPFNDERRGFQFRVNPLGVQMDAVNNDIDRTEDFSWDTIWSSAGRILDDGYVVEVAIPFNSLRFPSRTRDADLGLHRDARLSPLGPSPDAKRADESRRQLPRLPARQARRVRRRLARAEHRARPDHHRRPSTRSARTSPPGDFSSDPSTEAGITARWGSRLTSRSTATSTPTSPRSRPTSRSST